MGKATGWLKKAALPVVVLVGCLAAVRVHQAGEIDAGSYRVLRNAFKAGSPALKAQIAEAMLSGKVSHWEYRKLARQLAQEVSSIVVDANATNVAEERLVLAALARQVKAP